MYHNYEIKDTILLKCQLSPIWSRGVVDYYSNSYNFLCIL